MTAEPCIFDRWIRHRRATGFDPPKVVLVLLLSLISPSANAEPSRLRQHVIELADQTAREPHRPPRSHAAAADISYTDYLGIRVRPGREIWSHARNGFAVHPMPLGTLHQTEIELNIVEAGRILPQEIDGDFYQHSLTPDKVPSGGNFGISGFRVTAPLNKSNVMDEFVVFQGASYFRALSKGQVYGLSARGLAINTGQAVPEEFPGFRRFWIEAPHSPAALTFHALLDSPSVAGAFSFTVRPGSPTSMEVEASLYPRVPLHHVGLAPLTSMYFYSVGDGSKMDRDYRPAVHDSDGLLIENGAGERLWRPLRNPAATQVSSFEDKALRGFGLIQRQRTFDSYQDLEANYHRRPSAWIEPTGDWGSGAVELIELPTGSEFHDNIVAQWRPAAPLVPGQRFDYSYRITWPDDAPGRDVSALINWSRSGPAYSPASPHAERFVIDYSVALGLDQLPAGLVSASSGEVTGVTVQPNPATGGLRLSFLFEPSEAEASELRASLIMPSGKSETWLYRWIKAEPAL